MKFVGTYGRAMKKIIVEYPGKNEGIKPETFYTIKDGKIVEAKE